MYKNGIKERVRQIILLFAMRFADGERFEAMSYSLVKNVKWEDNSQ